MGYNNFRTGEDTEMEVADHSAPNGKAKQVVVESVALANALVQDGGYSWTSPSSLKLYPIIMLITLNTAMNGYDGSLMPSMNAMPAFHDSFNIGKQGSATGFFFFRYLHNRSARCTSGPIYVFEVSPPSMRGLFGGLYYSFGYCAGALVASWTCYGTGKMSGDWSWRIPVVIQAFPAAIIFCTVWLLPEFPRWQIVNGRHEKARSFSVEYYGNGNEDSAIVNLQMEEIERETNYDKELANNRWWDYRPLFSTRDRCFGIYLLILVSVFNKFVGGAVISFYLPVILDNIGIKSANKQLLINAPNVVFSSVASVFGCFYVDKFGRRNLHLWGAPPTGPRYILINVIAALAEGHVATGTGYAFVAFIYLYGIFFSFCWIPLQTLYPAEILPTILERRDLLFRSSWMDSLASSTPTLLPSPFNALVGELIRFSVGLLTDSVSAHSAHYANREIVVFHFIYLGMLCRSIVETKGRSLGEMDEISSDPHPVKKPLEKYKIVLAIGQGVKQSTAHLGMNDVGRSDPEKVKYLRQKWIAKKRRNPSLQGSQHRDKTYHKDDEDSEDDENDAVRI
ncbi:hypothetical protein V496_10165 [Pseudogymnoascus sp. VKM F-4515 (FW-2607)]|nr:hypothetical protein V496_10165 [Pseudogymnoascus sp. VKM F-4515 (FW-2607)]